MDDACIPPGNPRHNQPQGGTAPNECQAEIGSAFVRQGEKAVTVFSDLTPDDPNDDFNRPHENFKAVAVIVALNAEICDEFGGKS